MSGSDREKGSTVSRLGYLQVLASFVVLVWVGEAPPRAHLYIEVWQRTGSDTTWVKVVDQLPDEHGMVQQDAAGPVWVKARWRWEWGERLREIHTGPSPLPDLSDQTFYGTFSRPYYVAPEPQGRHNPPPERVRVP